MSAETFADSLELCGSCPMRAITKPEIVRYLANEIVILSLEEDFDKKLNPAVNIVGNVSEETGFLDGPDISKAVSCAIRRRYNICKGTLRNTL